MSSGLCQDGYSMLYCHLCNSANVRTLSLRMYITNTISPKAYYQFRWRKITAVPYEILLKYNIFSFKYSIRYNHISVTSIMIYIRCFLYWQRKIRRLLDEKLYYHRDDVLSENFHFERNLLLEKALVIDILSLHQSLESFRAPTSPLFG